jgi:hypothetical protein
MLDGEDRKVKVFRDKEFFNSYVVSKRGQKLKKRKIMQN